MLEPYHKSTKSGVLGMRTTIKHYILFYIGLNAVPDTCPYSQHIQKPLSVLIPVSSASFPEAILLQIITPHPTAAHSTSQVPCCFQPHPSSVLHFLDSSQFSSVQFSHSVVSDSLRPHESQHARPPCASPTPKVYSNSCPSSR